PTISSTSTATIGEATRKRQRPESDAASLGSSHDGGEPQTATPSQVRKAGKSKRSKPQPVLPVPAAITATPGTQAPASVSFTSSGLSVEMDGGSSVSHGPIVADPVQAADSNDAAFDDGNSKVNITSVSSSVDSLVNIGQENVDILKNEIEDSDATQNQLAFGSDGDLLQNTASSSSQSRAKRSAKEKGQDLSDVLEAGGVQGEPSGPKKCVNCGTMSTPLWRRGPQGLATLCNACGVKWRKKA
ncbi:hypothetical protein HDU82_005213, partial [Entophlyctis luteolus]